MFEIFEANYSRDSGPLGDGFNQSLIPDLAGLVHFFSKYGGGSFENGLYRTIRPADLPLWQERIGLGFPELENAVICFGYDWAGNVFALNTERLMGGQPEISFFEPGTGEVHPLPFDLRTFHERGLVDDCEAVLGESFYEEWRAAGGTVPAYDDCIGYRKPLFLGGKDDVQNLEVCDLDVYWHILGQLIGQTRGLPSGTFVRVNLD